MARPQTMGPMSPLGNGSPGISPPMYAPYEETANKRGIRAALANYLMGGGLSSAFAGLSAVRPGSNFGSAFLAGAGGGARAYIAQQEMARKYAQEQQDAADKKQEAADAVDLRKSLATLAAQKPDTKAQQYDSLVNGPQKMDPTMARQLIYGLNLDEQTRLATTKAAAAAAAQPQLNPSGMRVAEQATVSGGQPVSGMGAYKTQVAILNKIGKDYPNMDLAGAKAAYNSDRAALAKIQVQQDQINTLEKNVGRNTDVMLRTLKSVPETGIPVANALVRPGLARFGSVQVGQFNAALDILRPEFQKILSGTTGSSMAPSDASMKQIASVLRGDYTKAQLKGAISILRQDVANRKVSGQQQIREIQGRLSRNGALFGAVGAKPNDPLGILDANGQ